jgi:hypothetical protein
MPDTATLPPPRERPMRRDRFQAAAYWVLAAFLAVQLGLMAWLDVLK